MTEILMFLSGVGLIVSLLVLIGMMIVMTAFAIKELMKERS